MSIPTAAAWHSSAVYNEEVERDLEIRTHFVLTILRQLNVLLKLKRNATRFRCSHFNFVQNSISKYFESFGCKIEIEMILYIKALIETVLVVILVNQAVDMAWHKRVKRWYSSLRKLRDQRFSNGKMDEATIVCIR